ncbi:hypothetical protein NDU88_004110 [Pleurodeles waltl]|uniref:Uncharacterized protein n=1 Tax=Pleurodeles waltl TaxID=8319 RepID=A0AAV7KXF5_PLEWA|nr:hypothetical protein NDU88_004110 [Pleurodeles waltl]
MRQRRLYQNIHNYSGFSRQKYLPSVHPGSQIASHGSRFPFSRWWEWKGDERQQVLLVTASEALPGSLRDAPTGAGSLAELPKNLPARSICCRPESAAAHGRLQRAQMNRPGRILAQLSWRPRTGWEPGAVRGGRKRCVE